MQTKPMNIQTGLGVEALGLGLAYSWGRDSVDQWLEEGGAEEAKLQPLSF